MQCRGQRKMSGGAFEFCRLERGHPGRCEFGEPRSARGLRKPMTITVTFPAGTDFERIESWMRAIPGNPNVTREGADS